MRPLSNTGTIELQLYYQRNILEGLLIAVLVHITIFGLIMVFSVETVTTIGIKIRTPFEPLTFMSQPIMYSPTIAHKISLPNISYGTPIPIPEATISTQTELGFTSRNENGIDTSNDGRTGTIFSNDTEIGGEELPPEPFTAVEKSPIPVTHPAPTYPDLARRAGVEGSVFVTMWVTKEGKVKKAVIAKSTSEIFDLASIDAAMLWTFTPAIMNNGPVSVWVTVPFRFKLH